MGASANERYRTAATRELRTAYAALMVKIPR